MGDSASPTSLFRRINPPPTNWSKWCPECNTPSLKPPFECKGNGEDIHNYGRWTQPCDNGDCNNWLWHNAPTELDHIPYEVQMRHTIKKSARDEGPLRRMCLERRIGSALAPFPSALHAAKRPVVVASMRTVLLGSCHADARNPDISMAMSQAVGSLSAPEPVRREYARPLNEFYGKPYVASHRHLLVESSKVAAEERIKDLAYVVLWSKANIEFGTIRAPASAPPIVAASAESTAPSFISVLESTLPRPTWITQDLLLPIPVSATSRVLLKTCDIGDSDCLDFDIEVQLCGLGLTLNSTPTPVGSKAVATSAFSASSSTSSAGAGPFKPATAVGFIEKKFPLKYTCDMAPKMQILSTIKQDGSALRSAYAELFPGFEYAETTVHKHVAAYKKAVELKIVDKYIKLGKISNGKWTKLVREVGGQKNRKRTLAPVTIDLTGGEVKVDPISIDIDSDGDAGPSNTLLYDDNLASTHHIRRISVYRYMDNLLQDYSAPNNPDIDIEVFDCVTEGEKFIVNLARFTVVGHLQMNPITIAVKKLRSDDWAMNFPSLAAAVWTEGARTATCHMLFEHFKCRALAVGITVPENLDVAETSYIDLADTSPEGDVAWVGQPWHIGAPFSIHSLDLNDPNQVDIYSILSAFSHFTFQCTNHRSVYVDFQGLRTPHNNFVVLDSRTDVAHTSPMDDFAGDDDFKPPQFSVNNAPYFLGSLGDAGLAAFQTTHNCTGICGMMQLNPLPLIFP
ncbi:hypothetical protein C8J57DRAFT_1536441 [Mycena rebaudengoi]|nr:hypothetical protein C8J57DRAFT_1536441 [Mycena rebaudengoi]